MFYSLAICVQSVEVIVASVGIRLEWVWLWTRRKRRSLCLLTLFFFGGACVLWLVSMLLFSSTASLMPLPTLYSNNYSPSPYMPKEKNKTKKNYSPGLPWSPLIIWVINVEMTVTHFQLKVGQWYGNFERDMWGLLFTLACRPLLNYSTWVKLTANFEFYFDWYTFFFFFCVVQD